MERVTSDGGLLFGFICFLLALGLTTGDTGGLGTGVGGSIDVASGLFKCKSPFGPHIDNNTGKNTRPLKIPNITKARKHRKKYLEK